MLTEIEQIKNLLAGKKHVLIAMPGEPSGDAIGSALALDHYFTSQNQRAEIVSAGFSIPKNLKFLAGIEKIKSQLALRQKFIIKVDVSRAPIESLSYDVKDGWLSIHLMPKHGSITKNELRTAQTTFPYDLIITLDTVDRNALGDIFFNNTDLFYRVPTINIDHHAHNEHFGQINLVNLNAVATAEIVWELITNLNNTATDENTATAILTGLITKTNSFKTASVSPGTLQLAGRLIDQGANRELIIQNLYRTKTIPTLKLWGRVLSHMQIDRAHGLVWSSLTRDDFARSGTSPADLHGLINELLLNSPDTKMVLLIYESENGQPINGLLAIEKDYNALTLLAPFNPSGDKKEATFVINDKSLTEAETLVLNTIKQKINPIPT